MMKAQNECMQCGEGFVSPKNLERHIDERHLGRESAVIAEVISPPTTYRQHLPYVDEKQIAEAHRSDALHH